VYRRRRVVVVGAVVGVEGDVYRRRRVVVVGAGVGVEGEEPPPPQDLQQ